MCNGGTLVVFETNLARTGVVNEAAPQPIRHLGSLAVAKNGVERRKMSPSSKEAGHLAARNQPDAEEGRSNTT